jgi:hypothetical protein
MRKITLSAFHIIVLILFIYVFVYVWLPKEKFEGMTGKDITNNEEYITLLEKYNKVNEEKKAYKQKLQSVLQQIGYSQ